ncbi:MAG TPA: glycosyltransferase [Desulfomonilaceae bacterium]|nr:glycosyltransferase [Desulfomonilaceae bacterium]
MIKVLHVINWFRAGGVETQLMHVLREYDRSRFHMDVCVIGNEPGYLASAARELGATILSCRKSPNLFGFSNRFATLVRPHTYDIVHSHFEAWSGPILRGAKLAGVPVRIVHLHSMRAWAEESSFRPVERIGQTAVLAWGRHWVRQNCTHILAVSRAVVKQRFAERWNGRESLLLWTGGVDASRFSPGDGEQSSRAKAVIWVGGLLPSKRIDLQLQVFRLIREEVPEARLILVGEGKNEHDLRRLSQDLGVVDSVDFLGVRHDVPDLLRAAGVFLSCSQVEGLPTVILEAQACGLPVVATDIAPHREGLAPEFHPYLFPTHAPESAAKSVTALLQHPELRERLGTCGRKFVVDRFNAATQLAILQDHYTSWVCFGEENGTA